MRDALVVGINTYQALPSLKAPARDAEAIAQQLQNYGEFRVHRLPEVIQSGRATIGQKTQVTLRELENSLISLFKPKGNNIPQTALFYFSGHGIQREAGIREGYLALSDSQPDRGFYGLSLFWLRRLLQESPVRQRIVILDCCHSGELLNFLEADPGARSGTDRLFMAASREYETAFESLDDPYSVFTKAILAGLDPGRVESGIITNHSLTDHVNHALKGEIQQPLFESSGSEIILTRRNGTPSTLCHTNRSTDVCPYRGLEFFDETHAEYFFGREDLTAKLIDKLKTEHFVAVVGASGIGKSSLVRAGMIAQLRQQRTALGEERWRIKLLTPTEHPLKGLAAAFINPGAAELDRAEQLRRAEAFLQDGGAGLAQLVRASLPIDSDTSRLVGKERPRVLLIIDQFEEMFTLSHGSHAEKERQQFFNCLLEAMELAQDCLSIVVVLRTDFLPKCSLYEGLSQKVEQHKLLVSPLKYEQIKATIIRPAQKVGLVCEPSLIYTMLLDVSGAPGELPLLQYTLLELWQHRRINAEAGLARLTLDVYQELGGIRGTLQKRATEVFYSLTEQEQTIAKRIFLALTQLGEGTEDTRRRVAKSELVSAAYPAELVDRVLEKLVAAKLIVTNQDVDVIHEALIRNWSLLRNWLSENRDMLRRLRRIEEAAQEWDNAGQPPGDEYLLYGLRLRDAEDFLRSYPCELSALAQRFIAVSHDETRRARRESRQIQIAVPAMLLATLAVVFSQYHSAVRSQAEKNYQLQIATSRERAAIAQSILQDRDTDPMAALLISRLVAEQGGASFEAQSSLRAALQNLRLQLELRGHTGAVHHIAFSPDRRYLATASADGTIRIWSLQTQTIYTSNPELVRVLSWSTLGSTNHTNGGIPTCQNSDCPQTSEAAADIRSIAFSPDGSRIAAIARDSSIIKIWSINTGTIEHQLRGSNSIAHIIFSPNGAWLAAQYESKPGTTLEQAASIWQTETGQLAAHLISEKNNAFNSLQFSPDGQFLLSAATDKTARFWQLSVEPSGALTLKNTITLSHAAAVEQAIFSGTGQRVVTASADGTARMWDATTGQLLQTFFLQKQEVVVSNPEETSTVIPDGIQNEMLTGTANDLSNQVLDELLDNPHANSSDATPNESSPVNEVMPPSPPTFPDSSVTLTASPASEPTAPLSPPSSNILQVQFSPNEQTLAVVDANHQVWLWDVASGQIHTKFSTATHVSIPDAVPPPSPESNSELKPKGIDLLSFNSAGQLLVTASSDVVRPNGQYEAYLWDAQTGEQVGVLPGHEGIVEAAAFSPDGTYVVTASADGVVRLWSAKSGGELPTLTLPNTAIESAMFLPGGTARPNQNADGNLAPNHQATQSADIPIANQPGAHSRQLLSLYPASVQNPASVPPQTSLQANQSLSADAITAIADLVTVTDDNRLQHWQIRSASPTQASLPSSQVVAPANIDPHSRDSQLFWHRLLVLLGKPFRGFEPIAIDASSVPSQTVISQETSSVRPIPLPLQLVVTANTDLRNSSTNEGDRPTQIPENTVLSSVALSPNGRLIAMATPEGWVELRQLQADQSTTLVYQIRNWRTGVHADAILSEVVQSSISSNLEADSNSAASEALSPEAIAVDVTNSQGTPVNIRQLTFSPDGRWLLAIADDFTVRLWNVESGELVHVLRGHTATVQRAQFSPNGEWIVTASWDRTMRLWKASLGEEIRSISHPDAVNSATFSADSQRIVTASWDGIARIFDVGTGEQERLLTRHQHAILDAKFSPDGQLIVTTGADGIAYLWNAETGVVQAELRLDRPNENATAIVQASFSPDGRYVATLTKEGTVHLWVATWEMLLDLARDRSLRQLTPEECSRYLKLSPNECPVLPLGTGTVGTNGGN